MADDKATTQDTTQDTNTVSAEEYKNLQRQLAKQQKQNKELVLEVMAKDALQAEVADLGQMVQVLAKGVTDADDAQNDFDEIAQRAAARKQVEPVRAAISEALVESSLEWSDPQFEEARRLYSTGEYAKALDSVKVITNPAEDSFEDRVAAEVQKHLKTLGKVDGGDTIGTSGIPADDDELLRRLQDRSPDARKWRTEHRQELLQRAIQQQR